MLLDKNIPEVNKQDELEPQADEPQPERENNSKSRFPLFCDLGSDELWSDRSKTKKIVFVLWIVIKLIAILLCLYTFTTGLQLMSSGFLLIGKGSYLISDSQVLKNPVAGIVIGLLVTVCLQSSSASTSIAVSLVSSGSKSNNVLLQRTYRIGLISKPIL